MNPKLPLDGHILTAGSVLTTNVSQINLWQLLFLKVIMFGTTLGMDNFDSTKT